MVFLLFRSSPVFSATQSQGYVWLFSSTDQRYEWRAALSLSIFSLKFNSVFLRNLAFDMTRTAGKRNKELWPEKKRNLQLCMWRGATSSWFPRQSKRTFQWCHLLIKRRRICKTKKMGTRMKEDEKIERVIRGLLKLPDNRRCINCNSLV